MSSECEGKSSWPELVGVDGVSAAEIIEKENPLVNAEIMGENDMGTTDFDCTRVRVRVNDSGIVTEVPSIG